MDFVEVLKGLGSNTQETRDLSLNDLKRELRKLPKIDNSGLPERKALFKKIWNCIFYCSFLI